MIILSRLHQRWHEFWIHFYQSLVDDALDKDEKEIIYQKITHHKRKLH
ncbi:hypothetical protein [Ammoniphilus sp. YIM 78166]|nr:hypothetical protein [Ammoniphilus sp. YIM 78166]